jgi:hypothetical protein
MARRFDVEPRVASVVLQLRHRHPLAARSAGRRNRAPEDAGADDRRRDAGDTV